jgi:hypothetical protein
MEPQVILAQLRALIERTPDLENYSPTSREHLVWLGQAHALTQRWNNTEAIFLKNASDFLAMQTTRPSNIATIFGTLHRAIADLELKFPADAQVNFGAGDVYDFFKALNKLIGSAEKSLFIVDPYLDHTVFDHYLISRKPEVTVRLLLSKNAENVIPAAEKYISQFGNVLQVRKSKALHDRVIFIDGYSCWLIGQSVKDAAKAKPTYLVELPPDVAPEKLNNYEEIWSQSNEL